MKMCEPLQATLWQETELPLMSSRAASRAKTLAQQDARQEWAKAQEAACGPRLSDLLAIYDRATSSWRTSQTCLAALAKNEADGLAEFSETWPNAGMMRNGKTYRRQPWALPIAEKGCGLLPTPQASDGPKWHYTISPEMVKLRMSGGHQSMLAHWSVMATGRTGKSNPAFALLVMGFPPAHTLAAQQEMQSSPKSPNL